MNLVPKQPTTMGYNTIAAGVAEDEIVGPVPPVPQTSIRSRSCTKNDDHGCGTTKTGYWGPLIVAVFLTLLLGRSMYPGVGPSESGSLDYSVGSVVDSTATSATPDYSRCLPATGTFHSSNYLDSNRPYDNCFQLREAYTYCWTRSYYSENCYGNHCACIPVGAAWNEIDPEYVNPVTHPLTCGTACQDVHDPYAPTPAPTPKPDPNGPCLPAGGTFSGYSFTDTCRLNNPFETCFQLGDTATYCWTKSYFCEKTDLDFYGDYCTCVPDGDTWHPISAEYVNPVTQPNSCGDPCQKMHHGKNNNNPLNGC